MANTKGKASKPDISKTLLDILVREYQAGLLSNPQIGKEIGKSEGFVRKWAKVLGLKREKNIVTARGACVVVRDEDIPTPAESKEHAVRVASEVIKDHSSVLRTARTLAEQLLGELRILSDYPDEMVRVAEIVAHAQFTDDTDGKLVADRIRMYEKLLTLSNRSKDLNTLAQALTRIVDAERKAVGLDKEGGGNSHMVGGLGVTPESLLMHVIENKEQLTINLQVNNYGGSDDE
jgi:hypothetical protein